MFRTDSRMFVYSSWYVCCRIISFKEFPFWLYVPLKGFQTHPISIYYLNVYAAHFICCLLVRRSPFVYIDILITISIIGLKCVNTPIWWFSTQQRQVKTKKRHSWVLFGSLYTYCCIESFVFCFFGFYFMTSFTFDYKLQWCEAIWPFYIQFKKRALLIAVTY